MLFRCRDHAGAQMARGLRGGSGEPGALAAAAGGTLFIDGLEEADASAQSKLLEALRAPSSSVRVIGGTGRDLEAEVAAGRFSEELCYRFVVFVDVR